MSDAHRTLEFGPLREDDLKGVLELNQHWVPHVGPLERDSLDALLAMADLAVGVHDAGHLKGFVLAIGPDSPYTSPNYRWFSERHELFLYVDRVAVAPSAQRTGLGRSLYGMVIDRARSIGAGVVCAEVNLDPPNPESQDFHARMGFVEVGRQWTYGDTVEVQLLELAL